MVPGECVHNIFHDLMSTNGSLYSSSFFSFKFSLLSHAFLVLSPLSAPARSPATYIPASKAAKGNPPVVNYIWLICLRVEHWK